MDQTVELNGDSGAIMMRLEKRGDPTDMFSSKLVIEE